MRTLSSRWANTCTPLLCINSRTALAFLTALLAIGPTDGSDLAEAKTPGQTYCFFGTCHRVKSITETEALVGSEETLKSSFYDACEHDRLNPCGLTSSGEVFRPNLPDNAASPIYPDGTTLLVWSPETREAAVVRVNNAGPYWGQRKLDVSRATAERLGFKDRGVADLRVRVIDAPNSEEATYRKGRKYHALPGYIGQYASLEAAHKGMAAAMETIAPSILAPLTGAAVAAGPGNAGEGPSAAAGSALGREPGVKTASLEGRAEAGSDSTRPRTAERLRHKGAARTAAPGRSHRVAKRSKATLVAGAKSTSWAKSRLALVDEGPHDISMLSRTNKDWVERRVASKGTFVRHSASRAARGLGRSAALGTPLTLSS